MNGARTIALTFGLSLVGFGVPIWCQDAIPPTDGEVGVTDWAIILPPLPESLQDARRQGSRVRPRILQTQAEVARLLQEACTDLPPLPSACHPEDLPRAQTLVYILDDPKALELHDAFAEAWRAWQRVFAENGLAGPPREPEPAFQATEQTSPRVPEAERAAIRRSIFLWSLTGGNHALRNSQVVRQSMAPHLARTWSPYVDHLECQANRLLDIASSQEPGARPVLDALVRHAKVALLRRFQVALADSRIVWDLMTGN